MPTETSAADAPGESSPSAAGYFADFVRRIRAGDAQAATELVRQYEHAIRLEVRLRLRDPRMRRVFDSLDICQSVMASFFLGAAAGQFDLDEPSQLVRLLVGITRNKVAYQARKQRAQRRDNRRVAPLQDDDVQAATPAPSEVVAGKELLEEFRRRLSAEEQRVAEMRAEGEDWARIALELGGTPQPRPMQLTRAVKRVSQELGLEESGDD